MLTRCFFCSSTLPPNQVLEHFPVSDRVAYDPMRGRLWAVCPRCGRWVLAPFDSRWEALEELDRAVRDRGRLLARTDNVSLLRLGPVEVVHVGKVDLREEAWWRYGSDLARRVRRANAIARKGRFIDVAISLLLTGVPYWGWSSRDRWIERARRRAFGRNAWAERVSCERCGRSLGRTRFADRDHIHLHHAGAGVELRRGCRRCGLGVDGAGAPLAGEAGEHMLRRLLAYHNFAGGSGDQLEDATSAIRDAGSADACIRRIAEGGPRIGHLRPHLALGLEIAMHDARERTLLSSEATALDEIWREEERIAAIADGELTP